MTRALAPASLRRRLLAVLAAVTVAVGACTGADNGQVRETLPIPTEAEPTAKGPVPPADALAPLDRLRVARDGERPAIVDGSGRQVLLRGTNLNSLGDYAQPDLAISPTRPPTDEDWDQMAAHGFSVVRLVVSWSALEPLRGQIDLAYVQRIQDAVAAAAERRMYTVIDMHQDAWSRFVNSPPDVECRAGTVPAVGGDGAPLWATLTDGADTCRPEGDADAAPAVQAAFTAFYEDREGIRDAFTTTWGVLAGVFAGDPAVAGYDLFNEPQLVGDPAITRVLYADLVARTIARVREAELAAGGFPHLVFVEPLEPFPLPGSPPPVEVPVDDQIVFSPHAGAGVTPADLTVEQVFDLSAGVAAGGDQPLWIGEHVVAPGDAAADAAAGFARAQDAHLAGGAHWQWRQWCGDPHSIGVPGRAPIEDQVQLNVVSCPEDVDAGPNVDLLAVAGRAYPRAAPGLLTTLTSDVGTGAMEVEGRILDDLAVDGDLVLWIPGDERPELIGEGVGEPTLTQVPGGWYASVAAIDSPYRLEIR